MNPKQAASFLTALGSEAHAEEHDEWVTCKCPPGKGKWTHGMSRSPDLLVRKTYKAWQQMKYRCLNPNAQYYERYGGRGIKVCDRWMSFENFLADMGICPNPSLTLERKDNNLGYEPSNCKWATNAEQQANKSKGLHPAPLADSKVGQILKLKAEGLSTRKIAGLVGVSKSYVHKLGAGSDS